jgi:AraC family transcriptional regulator
MYVTADDQGLNKNCADHKDNIVMYSSIQNLEATLKYKNFSLKYVIEGVENYYLNGHYTPLKSGEFLLCNGTEEGKVIIENPEKTKGLCIGIQQEYISKVLASQQESENTFPEEKPASFFNSPDLFQFQIFSKPSVVGGVLSSLAEIIAKNPYKEYVFDQEFYFHLAEKIVLDYLPEHQKLRSIQCIKLSTKKDLLKKLSKGKLFIEQHFSIDIDIKKVARESGISEYHFYRLFKNVYGISPYQYLKQKRLEMAKIMLKKESIPISQLAQEVGYSDIFTFSKAYKQYFGHAPSHQF